MTTSRTPGSRCTTRHRILCCTRCRGSPGPVPSDTGDEPPAEKFVLGRCLPAPGTGLPGEKAQQNRIAWPIRLQKPAPAARQNFFLPEPGSKNKPAQVPRTTLKNYRTQSITTRHCVYLCDMKFLVQAFWLLFFYLLGLGVSLLIGGIIPGSVLGMVLLFMALAFGWLPVQRIERIAELLLDNMILFLLPAAVGLITSVGLISANLVAILVAATVSTVLIVAVVAGTQQRLEIRKRKRKIREGGHETR